MHNSLEIFVNLEKILSLVNIVVYIAVVIIALNCVWRVEKQLDRFLKYLTLSISLVPLRLVMNLVGLEQQPVWAFVFRCFGFLSGLLLIIAFTDLLRSIKNLNHENSD